MSDSISYERANPLQKAMRRAAATGPGARLLAALQHRIDRPLYRLTGGRHTLGSLLAGLPVVMLTTTGARTGRPRTVPVLGLPTSEGLVVVASNYGRERDPAWCRNLRAQPAAEVAIDGRARRVRAVEADGARRERIWQEGLRVYPGWSAYARRAPHRRIAVFVLEPA